MREQEGDGKREGKSQVERGRNREGEGSGEGRSRREVKRGREGEGEVGREGTSAANFVLSLWVSKSGAIFRDNT